MCLTVLLPCAAGPVRTPSPGISPRDPARLDQPGFLGLLCVCRGRVRGPPGDHDAAQPHGGALHRALRLLPRPGTLLLVRALAASNGRRQKLPTLEGAALQLAGYCTRSCGFSL